MFNPHLSGSRVAIVGLIGLQSLVAGACSTLADGSDTKRDRTGTDATTDVRPVPDKRSDDPSSLIRCTMTATGAFAAPYGSTIPAGTPFSWEATFVLDPDADTDRTSGVGRYTPDTGAPNTVTFQAGTDAPVSGRITTIAIYDGAGRYDRAGVLVRDMSGSVGGVPQPGRALSLDLESFDDPVASDAFPRTGAVWSALAGPNSAMKLADPVSGGTSGVKRIELVDMLCESL